MSIAGEHIARPRLSVAMIVRDEEEVLAESLASVRPIADQIVVLDTGSSDQTVAVAHRFGATVGWMPWGDDFSAARNRCLTLANGDWILWLDAGETLGEESVEELRSFVDEQADPAKAYILLVQVPPVDPAASAEQAAQVRLIPNRKDLRFEGRVRETLQPSIEASGLQIEAAAGRIVCHARRHDQARKLLCAGRDLRLAALERAAREGPLPPRLPLAMGEAYANAGADEQARRAFREAIDAAQPGSTEMLEAYYGLLTSYDGDKFLADVQLSTCVEALEVFPFDAQLLLVMGNYLQNKDRLDLAARAFSTAVKHGQVDLGAWHLAEVAEVAANCLSLLLETQEKFEEARAVLEESLRGNPDSDRLRRRLIDLHVKQGRCDEALGLADRLAVPPEQREPLRNAVRGACRAAARDWTAALGYLQSAYAAGCGDPICLRHLAVTLLSNGQTEAAEPVLKQWQQVEPTNVELQAYLAAIEQHRGAAAGRQSPSPQQPVADFAERRLRVDQGTTTLEAAPPRLPIITQTSSVEAAPPGT